MNQGDAIVTLVFFGFIWSFVGWLALLDEPWTWKRWFHVAGMVFFFAPALLQLYIAAIAG